jgi:outer membrane protein OmpA-like peptidoglycan-associated protein
MRRVWLGLAVGAGFAMMSGSAMAQEGDDLVDPALEAEAAMEEVMAEDMELPALDEPMPTEAAPTSTSTVSLRATIWVDPDGCEHWVIDDGAEGYMSSHLGPDGKPVCRGAAAPPICKTFDSDTLFAIDSSNVSASARESLSGYFQSVSGSSVRIDGHTDSTGSDAYNMRLSQRRAEAVAAIARSFGVEVETAWFGERSPKASNATRDGRRQNRRVEVRCKG